MGGRGSMSNSGNNASLTGTQRRRLSTVQNKLDEYPAGASKTQVVSEIARSITSENIAATRATGSNYSNIYDTAYPVGYGNKQGTFLAVGKTGNPDRDTVFKIDRNSRTGKWSATEYTKQFRDENIRYIQRNSRVL